MGQAQGGALLRSPPLRSAGGEALWPPAVRCSFAVGAGSPQGAPEPGLICGSPGHRGRLRAAPLGSTFSEGPELRVNSARVRRPAQPLASASPAFGGPCPPDSQPRGSHCQLPMRGSRGGRACGFPAVLWVAPLSGVAPIINININNDDDDKPFVHSHVAQQGK